MLAGDENQRDHTPLVQVSGVEVYVALRVKQWLKVKTGFLCFTSCFVAKLNTLFFTVRGDTLFFDGRYSALWLGEHVIRSYSCTSKLNNN